MSQPLRLSAKEETANKTFVLCGERLTPLEREIYIDMCHACVFEDATDNELDND